MQDLCRSGVTELISLGALDRATRRSEYPIQHYEALERQ